jgi:ABC-type bacteriocin/lantibiotic exporter with double-glycine peptidase domain
VRSGRMALSKPLIETLFECRDHTSALIDFIAAFLGVVISALGLATAIFSQKLIDHLLPEKNIDKLIFGIILFGFILVTA